MRAIFLALCALAVVSAVSLKNFKPRFERSEIDDGMKFFAEASRYGDIPMGKLTSKQKKEIWKRGLDQVDTSGDNKISRKEFLTLLPSWASKNTTEVKKANETFDEIDTKKNGFLDIDEMITYWRNFDPSSERNSGFNVAAP